VLVGCGDNAVLQSGACDAATVPISDLSCGAPRIFAARDSLKLIPDDEAVNEYHDRWAATVHAEPILYGRIPQRYTSRSGMVTFKSSNETVVGPLTMGQLTTGETSFDSLLKAIGSSSVRHTFLEPNGPYQFSVSYGIMFNEEVFADALAEEGCDVLEPEVYPTDDGRWTWVSPDAVLGPLDNATAVIDFRFGWGDCFVQCDGFRTLRATVSPDDVAVVQDMGGDTLPPYLQLSPATLPPP
jgi:hypothetical protein